MVKGFVPQAWRLKKSRYGLWGSRCSACGAVRFPSRTYCASCKKESGVPHKLSGGGVVVTYTTIRSPPTGYEGRTPYVVVLVRLDDGPHITAQLDADPQDAKIGTRVVGAFRKLHNSDSTDMLFYGFKFVPA